MTNKISNVDIESFIREYITALEILIEGRYNKVKSIDYEMGFPLEFPVRVNVYLIKRGILFNYDKSDFFEIIINKNERPKKKSRWGEFLSFNRFSKLKDNPHDKAESDIQRLLNLPKMIEENEQEMALYYETLWYNEMIYTIEHYIKFLDETKNVIEKTKSEKTSELYAIINTIQNHLSRFDFPFQISCHTIDKTYFMTNSDLETSFFLAINGKYYTANSILRKILEVNVRSIFSDFINQQDENKGKEIRDNWLINGKFPYRFIEIVDTLVDDELDIKITKLLKEMKIFKIESFKGYINYLYRKLCTYVHLRPTVNRDQDLKLTFSEFDVDRFNTFYNLFNNIIKICEILLVITFPKILLIEAISSKNHFSDFSVLSKQELEVLVNELS